jgi:uncharacterized protein with von Willebrand factor type A (vWA) domain
MKKQRRNVKYSTIQIREYIKRDLTDYCDRKGYKISRYMELLFLADVSGSMSGSVLTK